MNVNSINSPNFQGIFSKLKTKKLKVNELNELDASIKKRLELQQDFFAKVAKEKGIANLNLFQKGDLLLINASGPKTTAYPWKKFNMDTAFDRAIISNMQDNACLKKGGTFSSLIK